jgi:hypothetical protein
MALGAGHLLVPPRLGKYHRKCGRCLKGLEDSVEKWRTDVQTYPCALLTSTYLRSQKKNNKKQKLAF